MSICPKVSVCIPVYNAGDLLRPAIDSVLKQDFKDFELIIVDDCSTHPTEADLVEFDDERLYFQRNIRNLGLVGNWNRCLELAQGEYITIFHQDDVMLSGNLTHKAAMLDANSAVGFVYSNIQSIDQIGQVIGGHWIPQPRVDTLMSGEAVFEMVAATGNPISCPSVVTRRECYERLGKFNANLPFATDLEMWMRIATNYDVGYLAQPLVAQRVHLGQETKRFQGTGKDYLDVLHALDIIFSHSLPLNYSKYAQKAYKTLSLHAIRMAKWKFRQSRITNGLRYLAVAVKCLSRIYLHQNTYN